MTGQLPPFTTADFKWKPIWKILVATDFPVRKVFEGWGIPHLKKKWDGCLDDQQEKSCDELANFFRLGSFRNYVDKMRLVGGQKCLFLSRFGVKNVHIEVGSQKRGKSCPRSYRMTPNTAHLSQWICDVIIFFLKYFSDDPVPNI